MGEGRLNNGEVRLSHLVVMGVRELVVVPLIRGVRKQSN